MENKEKKEISERNVKDQDFDVDFIEDIDLEEVVGGIKVGSVYITS